MTYTVEVRLFWDSKNEGLHVEARATREAKTRDEAIVRAALAAARNFKPGGYAAVGVAVEVKDITPISPPRKEGRCLVVPLSFSDHIDPEQPKVSFLQEGWDDDGT